MPYNNTPIAPPTENAYTGETKLPLARVKKIIAADEDIGACSANAAFAITIAAEMFIQHLVSQTSNVIKSEKRPRRNIAYKDVAAAVAKYDDLEFLTDVVPRQVTYRQFVARKSQADRSAGTNGTAPGAPQQRTLDNMGRPMTAPGQQLPEDGMDVDGAAAVPKVLQESPRSARSAGTRFDLVTEEVKGGPMEED